MLLTKITGFERPENRKTLGQAKNDIRSQKPVLKSLYITRYTNSRIPFLFFTLRCEKVDFICEVLYAYCIHRNGVVLQICRSAALQNTKAYNQLNASLNRPDHSGGARCGEVMVFPPCAIWYTPDDQSTAVLCENTASGIGFGSRDRTKLQSLGEDCTALDKITIETV